MNALTSLWAGLAVLGFAMVFSVPRKTLPGIILMAIGAHLIRSIIQFWGGDLPTASFVAALAVGTVAAIVAPRTNQATPIYAYAPVIPLIPGTYMFNALSAAIAMSAVKPGPVIGAEVDQMIGNTSTATLTVIALAVGATAPGLLAGRRLARLGNSLPSGRNISVLRTGERTDEEGVL